MATSPENTAQHRPIVCFYLTSFGDFCGVDENPTQWLVDNIHIDTPNNNLYHTNNDNQDTPNDKLYHTNNDNQDTPNDKLNHPNNHDDIENPCKHGIPARQCRSEQFTSIHHETCEASTEGNWAIIGTESLEVSCEACEEAVPRLHNKLSKLVNDDVSDVNGAVQEEVEQGCVGGETCERIRGRSEKLKRSRRCASGGVVLIHFGVNTICDHFCIEKFAFNDTSFSVPDKRGYQPMRQEIRPKSPPQLQTTLPTQSLCCRVGALCCEDHIVVQESNDPGRFVCNYLYYLSLLEGKQSGVETLFVHVPSFAVYDKMKQLRFVKLLLGQLSCQTPQPDSKK